MNKNAHEVVVKEYYIQVFAMWFNLLHYAGFSLPLGNRKFTSSFMEFNMFLGGEKKSHYKTKSFLKMQNSKWIGRDSKGVVS